MHKIIQIYKYPLTPFPKKKKMRSLFSSVPAFHRYADVHKHAHLPSTISSLQHVVFQPKKINHRKLTDVGSSFYPIYSSALLIISTKKEKENLFIKFHAWLKATCQFVKIQDHFFVCVCAVGKVWLVSIPELHMVIIHALIMGEDRGRWSKSALTWEKSKSALNCGRRSKSAHNHVWRTKSALIMGEDQRERREEYLHDGEQKLLLEKKRRKKTLPFWD